MAELFEKTLTEGLSQMQLAAADSSVAQCCKFFEYLQEQNRVMNLTAISGEEESAQLHFLDCAALLQAADFSGKRVIDVGTGAGFPGMPLKLLGPQFDLLLLDSQQKRIDFLKRACTLLQLDRVECVHARAEEVPQYREQFDFAVSRAVARLSILSELCLPFVRPGGLFLSMKGPGAAEEAEEAAHAIKTLGGTLRNIYEYAIPGTDTRHCVVIIEKTAPTPKAYPRRFAKIQKSPL